MRLKSKRCRDRIPLDFLDFICGNRAGQNRDWCHVPAATELAGVQVQGLPVAPRPEAALRLRALEGLARERRVRLRHGRRLHVDKQGHGVPPGRGVWVGALWKCAGILGTKLRGRARASCHSWAELPSNGSKTQCSLQRYTRWFAKL